MAIYVIGMHVPPLVVLTTDDTEDAAKVAQGYADANRVEVHIVAGTPTVVTKKQPAAEPTK